MLSSIGEGVQTSRRVRVALGLIVADIAKTQVLTEADASGYTTFRAYERATQKIVYRAWRYESEGTGWSFAKTHDWAVMQDDMRNTMRAGYAGAVASALKALGAEAELPYSGGGREIEAMTNEDSLRLVGFFSFIRENSKEEGGKWSTVKARLRIWQLRWKEIKSMAMAFAAKAMKGKGKLLTWIFGPTEEHCFIAGTQVLTIDGEQPIETIEPGQLVWTRDGWRSVLKRHEHEHDGEMIQVTVGGRTVTVTSEHRFWTGRGWVEAGDLRVGQDRMGCKNITTFYYSTIIETNLISNLKGMVYNLAVAGRPEYVAETMMVHNCEDCTRYRGHTYPASMWAAVGALPQSRNLACRGFRCECRLIPSKGPISSGEPRPPRYSLGGRLSLF